MYEWEGKIENDSEVLMMIKTRTVRVAELTEFVKSMTTITFDSVWNKYKLHASQFSENHPYDVCEVITTSIEDGNKEYIDWIGKVVPAAGKTEGSSQE